MKLKTQFAWEYFFKLQNLISGTKFKFNESLYLNGQLNAGIIAHELEKKKEKNLRISWTEHNAYVLESRQNECRCWVVHENNAPLTSIKYLLADISQIADMFKKFTFNAKLKHSFSKANKMLQF